MSKERAKLNNLLEKTIEAEVNERVATIKSENDDLNARVQRLQSKVSELTLEIDNVKHDNGQASVMYNMINAFKDKFYSIEQKPKREELVYKMLECFFNKDFEEDTYECPVWLGACTNFYSHKGLVVDILKALDIHIPNNIDSFRLPQDWDESELDIVFETMRRHIVCNCQTYSNNLRFWKPNALDDVNSVCHCGTYSEIPWQFLLRNPNLLKEKYLKKIAKMAFEESYVSGWRYLFNIDKYQQLTDEQIKFIINNLNVEKSHFSTEFKSVDEFLLRHLELIENEDLLEKMYNAHCCDYSFEYKHLILKMPEKYLSRWIVTRLDPLYWIKNNRQYLTEEQVAELTELVMKKILKI